MSQRSRLLASLFVFAVTGVAACKKNPPTTTASVQPVRANGTVEAAVAQPPPGRAGQDPEGAVLSEDVATLNRKGYLVDAFFDFSEPTSAMTHARHWRGTPSG